MAFENLKSTGIKYVLTKLKDYFLQIKDAVKSVNGEEPDEDGNITINTVPYAQNLESESSHRNYDTFIQRTSGGESSVENGDAWLMAVKGNNEHTGYVAESLDMTVTALGEEPITATLNRDTFVAYVATSGTTTLVYSTAWSADPTLYGVTVTGTPVAGDTITIVYVKEVRGTITVSDPQSFVSTGWNLYNHSNGYAKVCKYDFGYRISGTYTSIKFATTPTGTQSDITVNDGNFNVPSDGYIIVTGGNSTDTAIFASWEDWTEGYTGDFKSYTQSVVDLSTIMTTYFPYGLLKAGSSVDEIDLNLGQAISRVERMGYTDENLATAKASGREYEYDENYIYLARETATSSSISVDGDVRTDDHGIEFFTDTEIPVYTEILYGNNLKNKLERDVLTFSNDLVDNLTTNDSKKALSAKQGKILNDYIGTYTYALHKDKMIAIASNTDLNNLTTPGSYFCASSTIAATLSNSPINNAGFSLHVESVAGATGQYIIQTIRRIRTSAPGALEYSRCNSGGWYNWGSVQEDIARKLADSGEVSGNSSVSLTLAGSTSALIVVTGNASDRCALFVVKSNSGATTSYIQKIGGGADITAANSSGKVVITNSASAGAFIYVTAYTGSVTFPST